MSAPIETTGLRKVYHAGRKNQIVALDGLNLEVQEGHIFGFIGPNGAGKSTTIKTLVGLTRQTAGEARIFGASVGSVEARRKLGYLPEVASYHEFMTVGELLDVHARLARTVAAERSRLCKEALDVVGLAARHGSRIRELSKGMKQRFGIAQALVANPPLLILDELTSGLDPLAQKELKDVILSLKRRGMTIFFSSHKLTEVENICDIIGIVHRGKLLACGPLDTFLLVDDQVDIAFKGDASDKLRAAGLSATATHGTSSVTVPRDRVDRVLQDIHEAQGTIWSVQPRRLTLEDAFFNLIQAQGPVQSS